MKVDQAAIIKGYEVNKGEYVELDPEELEAVAIESKRTIEIDEFVPKSDIDEIYMRDPYFIVPDGEVGQPLTIPEVADLRTLADVRELFTHLPERCQDKSTWQHVIVCLEEAALDGDTQNVAIPLRMVLAMEGVECRPL
jgi:Ku70/Ku80 beta-barrel domain